MNEVPEPHEIRCGPLRARIHADGPTLELRVAGATLGPLGPVLEGPWARAWREGPWVRAAGRVKGLAGRAERVEIQAVGSGGLGVRWWVEVDAEGDGVAAGLALENRGARGLPLAALAPLAWSPPARGLLEALWTDAAGRVRESLGLAPAPSPGGPAALLGFTTARRGFGQVEPAAGRWVARSAWPNGRLAPGTAAESERAWLGLGGSLPALRAAWARMLKIEAPVG